MQTAEWVADVAERTGDSEMTKIATRRKAAAYKRAAAASEQGLELICAWMRRTASRRHDLAFDGQGLKRIPPPVVDALDGLRGRTARPRGAGRPGGARPRTSRGSPDDEEPEPPGSGGFRLTRIDRWPALWRVRASRRRFQEWRNAA